MLKYPALQSQQRQQRKAASIFFEKKTSGQAYQFYESKQRIRFSFLPFTKVRKTTDSGKIYFLAASGLLADRMIIIIKTLDSRHRQAQHV
jgi:hypothetical protein